MKSSKFSLLRLYGIFVFVSVIFLVGIIYGYLQKDPLLFWTSIILFVILGIIRILIIIRSLLHKTEQQKKHTEKLQVEQNKLLALVNSLGEAVFALDKKGRVSVYNSAAMELIDSHEDLSGQLFDKILSLQNKDNQIDQLINTTLHESKVVTRDDLHTTISGKEVSLYILVTPIKQAGELVGVLVMARDISKQKSLQQQKDEFLSVVSHELRTPVAIVEADISTVLSSAYIGGIEPKTEKLLRSAAQNITYLSGLLQDLSDLSHSERPVLDVELHSIDSDLLCKELVESMTERAKLENIELVYLNEKDLPKITSSDQRVREILINFLTNAIKYSASKGKKIELSTKVSQKYPEGIQFSVEDDGFGISDEEQKKLFHKFYRSSSEEVQAIKGTGMGLYITMQQAKKLGGDITFKSELGKGSTFYLDLPTTIPVNKVTTTQ